MRLMRGTKLGDEWDVHSSKEVWPEIYRCCWPRSSVSGGRMIAAIVIRADAEGGGVVGEEQREDEADKKSRS
jgi:hypothetical protein